MNRRDFLKGLCGGMAVVAASGLPSRLGAAVAVESQPTKMALPTIQLGKHSVTRLIAGGNPISGYSHTTLNMARHMREYFTVERTAEFLEHCEHLGINTWQCDHTEKAKQALRLAREHSCGIQFICLHAERSYDAPLKEVMELKPIAIAHSGGVTDAMFRAGKLETVHDFVKKVHDCGVLAGVSAHNPQCIQQIEEEGWENDFFMTCFYYVTRLPEEMQKALGNVTVGEPFFQSDPDDMTRVMRQVKKPCLGFKILAAGRLCWTRQSVENAFKYAFRQIKRTDAVIVGMFPLYTDEVSENAGYTMKHGGA